MLKKTAPALLLGLLFCVLLGLGCSGNDKAAAYQKISATQAKTVMDSEAAYVLLDVRTEEEFRDRRIKGAILMPYTEIGSRAAAELPDKEALILIYCRSGRRSAIAANELARAGYMRVYDFGGINDWPYATVSGAGSAK